MMDKPLAGNRWGTIIEWAIGGQEKVWMSGLEGVGWGGEGGLTDGTDFG